MRTVTVEILKAALGSVEQVLEDSGFERFDTSTGQWNYPPGSEAVLYAVCEPYSADPDDPEDRPRIEALLGGALPTVEVLVDVSGRVEGEAEVLHLVECLLSVFEGFALDDFTSHAWTLDEIRHGQQFNGLGFFDYRGAYEQSRKPAGAVVAEAE